MCVCVYDVCMFGWKCNVYVHSIWSIGAILEWWTSPPQMFLFVCIYTWNPCFGWKRLSFEGFGFKNRGHLGSSYIYTYIYIYIYWSKLLNNHHIPDEIQKCWYGLKWRRRATRSQFWNLLPVWKLLRCWCITILIDFYILVLPSCMSFLKRRPKNHAKLGVTAVPAENSEKVPRIQDPHHQEKKEIWYNLERDSLGSFLSERCPGQEIQDGVKLAVWSFSGLRNSRSASELCFSISNRRLVCFPTLDGRDDQRNTGQVTK